MASTIRYKLHTANNAKVWLSRPNEMRIIAESSKKKGEHTEKKKEIREYFASIHWICHAYLNNSLEASASCSSTILFNTISFVNT